MIGYLFILLVNLIYIQCWRFGLISDDKSEMEIAPYNARQEKRLNTILHLVVGWYIYYAFGCSLVSLTAAVLFSIHPLAVQVPAWKSGRQHGYDGLIFLVVLAFAPLTIPFYFTFHFGYPTIIFTPLIFIFTKHWYIAFLTPFMLWRFIKPFKVAMKAKIEGGGIMDGPGLPKDVIGMQTWKWRNLIIVVKTFGYYSLACLLPLKNGFYNSFLGTLVASKKTSAYWYSFNRQFWGGIAAMAMMAVIWWFNRDNFIGIGIMLFVLSIGPYCNWIILQMFVTPRYAYVALIGFQVALAGLLVQLGFFGILVSVGLGLFYLIQLIRVLPHYKKDNITLIELDSQIFPDYPSLWYLRYEHWLYKQNYVMAWAEAAYGLKHHPEDCQLYFGLAVASFHLGDLNAATEFVKTSERFMVLADRENMAGYIVSLKAKIEEALRDKWVTQANRRFRL